MENKEGLMENNQYFNILKIQLETLKLVLDLKLKVEEYACAVNESEAKIKETEANLKEIYNIVDRVVTVAPEVKR
jgi:hypothetical protein